MYPNCEMKRQQRSALYNALSLQRSKLIDS